MEFKKNYLDYSGEKLKEYELKIEDAYFLDWLKTFSLASSSDKMLIDNKVLIWVNYAKVLKDLELIFQSRATLIRKIEHMIKKNILIKHLKKEEQKLYIGFGNNYESLLYWNSDMGTNETEQEIPIPEKKKKEVPEIKVSSFDWFWNTYDKKVGRDKCYAKFLKLKLEDIEKIKETLPAYIDSTPEKKYRKNPLTYLNGTCWNDEITKVVPTIPKVIKPQGIDYKPNQRRFTDEDD